MASKTQIPLPFGYADAVFSDCGKYRYQLTRHWEDRLPMVMFLMLNPSTADGLQDDPTIRRCIGFAKSWGYGSLVVANLFAYRSTDPDGLLAAEEPVGPDNLEWVEKSAAMARKIVCAWGNAPIIKKLSKKLGSDFLPVSGTDKLFYIKMSKSGTPWHPLFITGGTPLTKFKP